MPEARAVYVTGCASDEPYIFRDSNFKGNNTCRDKWREEGVK
jgi:hypothetical protein